MGKVNNPFQRTGLGVFDWPDWVGYTFGSLLLLIGLLTMLLYKKTKQKSNKYKEEQLLEYNKKYNRKETKYENTGMYLPMGERAKMWWPILLGLTLAIIGLSWIVGNTLTTL